MAREKGKRSTKKAKGQQAKKLFLGSLRASPAIKKLMQTSLTTEIAVFQINWLLVAKYRKEGTAS